MIGLSEKEDVKQWITVEIGGDTMGLDKALKGVQSTLQTV